MRVLVTGAFGFIGTAVGRRLALAGYDVVAMTSRPLGTAPAPLFPCRVVRADLRDEGSVRAALADARPEGVCHLAGLGKVRESFEHPGEYHAVNAGGTKTLLEALTATGTGSRFVFASSVAVYGVPERQPVTEDAPLLPTSPYGESKVAAEQAIETAVTSGAIGAVCLRVFNAAGAVAGGAGGAGVADSDLSRVIPKALAVAAGQADRVAVNGDGSAVRDFVHVDDVASAFLLAMENGCRPGRAPAYNVGATAASVAEILAVTGEVTGRPIPVVRNPPRNEPQVLISDHTRIGDELGWSPARSALREIVADAWAAVSRA